MNVCDLNVVTLLFNQCFGLYSVEAREIAGGKWVKDYHAVSSGSTIFTHEGATLRLMVAKTTISKEKTEEVNTHNILTSSHLKAQTTLS